MCIRDRYAGAGFQIYDPNGNLVTMTFTYPEVTTIDTFYTTADGDLITPQTLEYGKGYSLVEVQAPYGYVLNSEPVYFDVVQENSEEESGITVIEVVRSNMAQKGTITVEKSGEVFSSVAGDKGLYQPIFSVSGLEGAVYEITAAEDIVTPVSYTHLWRQGFRSGGDDSGRNAGAAGLHDHDGSLHAVLPVSYTHLV